ncbi:sugar ABC transporter substrate-binding protein [Actinoplanes lobatus]|uniref:Putative multiple sugar transport system substrate-binding protein n=1 Tax=Actinoplanes lobatus TaxID=113568 RepID=A0A7W7HJD2_9ACTN|nr:multiple monosaccharide ABC transporter substrate-binding protein [Actinoplanes lobatus]MBB4751628.1 putative multiple sugar transport system substrate-binding protein [Actinoplanes lobatus]GGN65034.1 sugar ABC transporter substrate-binding protein [Actinoplanes lobatus]GIE43212.1 sugar ABC transporter substrate-binding protein [Actinoplanes lobatus]
MARWVAWAATAALLATTAACGSESGTTAAAAEQGVIGLAMPTKASERWIGDGENMVKQFQLLGYRTDMQYADDDIQLQVDQIDAMVDAKVSALVIGAIDGTALKSVLSKAARADIPVIAYDRLIRDSPDIAYYATFDNFKVGVQQGGAIVNALKLRSGKGPFNIELFAGSADDNNATFFFNGAMSVLKPYISSGKLVVRSGQTKFADVATLRWDGAVAQKRMTGLLKSEYAGTQVDAVLSPYDGITRGILAALKEAGYGSKSRPLPVLTGQDAELDSVKLIAAGEQTETVYKDTRELAKVAVQMTDSVLSDEKPMINDTKQYHNGVEIVPTFLLQPVNVDKSNYERVLVDGGYYTAEQIAA